MTEVVIPQVAGGPVPTLDEEFIRVGRGRAATRDAGRRSVAGWGSNVVAIVGLALGPLIDGSAALFGDLTIVQSLSCLAPGLVLWTLNFLLYRMRGPDGLYRWTQNLELFALHLFLLGLIFFSGTAASVIWAGVAVSAVIWPVLRPLELRANLIVAHAGHLLLIVAFASRGQSDSAVFVGIAALLFTVLLTAGHSAARSSIRLEALRNIARESVQARRMLRVRENVESALQANVGNELGAIIDEVASLNEQGLELPAQTIEKAQEALAELERVVWARGALDETCSLEELAVLLEKKCAGLLPERAYLQRLEGDPNAEVNPNVARTLLHVAQELTRNAVVHGRASLVEVALMRTETTIRLQVCDDGSGLGADQKPKGGLRNAQERAMSLGGSVQRVRRGPRWSTCMEMSIPPRANAHLKTADRV